MRNVDSGLTSVALLVAYSTASNHLHNVELSLMLDISMAMLTQPLYIVDGSDERLVPSKVSEPSAKALMSADAADDAAAAVRPCCCEPIRETGALQKSADKQSLLRPVALNKNLFVPPQAASNDRVVMFSANIDLSCTAGCVAGNWATLLKPVCATDSSNLRVLSRNRLTCFLLVFY